MNELETEVRARDLFVAAQEMERARRAEFLDVECQDHTRVRARVELLLDAYDAHSPALDTGLSPFDKETAPKDEMPAMPRSIGPYALIERIGAGGMGVVFRAEQAFPRRTVALKVVRATGVDGSWLVRFRNEVETLGRLQHPGIAQVYDAGVLEGGLEDQPWFAMELVEGTPITDFADRHELSAARRCELMARVCDAVQHAHDRHVVHRDLKPSNILVRQDDDGQAEPKLLDFGVARSLDCEDALAHTLTGALVGTPAYMSPEQLVTGSAIDTRSDVFALGVILYELLSGVRPAEIDEKGLSDFIRRVTQTEPRPLRHFDPALRGDLETICAKALAREPQQRYQTARAMAEDLRRWLQHLPIRARRPSSWYHLSRFARRHKPLVFGAVATLLVLCAGIIATTIFAVRATYNEEVALRHAYAANVTHAVAVGRTDPLRAEEHLAAANEKFRGFEWHYARATIDECRRFLKQRFSSAFGTWDQQCAIAWPADGEPIYARTRRTHLELVDVATGRVGHSIVTDGEFRHPALSAGGRHVAALARFAGDRWKLGLWNTETAELELQLDLPPGRPGPVAVRADGAVIAVTRFGAGSALVDVATGAVRRLDPPHAHEFCSPAAPTFSKDGQTVGIGSGLYDVATARRIGERPAPFHIWQLSQDSGELVAHARWRRRRIDLVDPRSGEVVRMLPGLRSHPVWMEFSRDGRRLAAAGYSGGIMVWDVQLGVTLRAFPDRAAWLAFDATGQRLVACTPRGPVEFDIDESGSRALRGHDTYVYLVAYSPDGKLLASVDQPGTLILWDVATAKPLRRIVSPHPPLFVTFSADGSVVQMLGHHVESFDTATGERIEVPPLIAPHRSPLVPSEIGAWDAMSADRSVHASANRETVTMRDAAGRSLGRIHIPPPSVGESVRLIRARSNLARTHPFYAATVAVGPDNRTIAVGHQNGSLHVFDRSGQRRGSVQRHFGPIYGVAFSPDGRRIATAGNDGTVQLWDADSLDQVGVLRAHKSYVKDLAFRPDGKQLATASGDGTVRLWDAEPARARRVTARAAKAAATAMRPFVARTLHETGSLRRAAAAIRSDSTLADDERGAALRVLLQLSGESRAAGK